MSDVLKPTSKGPFSIMLDSEEIAALIITKEQGGFNHTYNNGNFKNSVVVSSPLGTATDAQEGRFKKWLVTCLQKTKTCECMSFEPREVIGSIMSTLHKDIDPFLDELESLPAEELKGLSEMIEELRIIKQLDGEQNYPVVLKIKWKDTTKELKLDDKTIFSLAAVRSAFLREFHQIPSEMFELEKDEWGKEIINKLAESNKVVEIEAADSTENFLCQCIVGEIYRSRPVADPKEAVMPGTYLWQDNAIWIPNTRIKDMMKAEHVSANLRKVSEWVKPISAGNAKDFRVGVEERLKFWPFSATALKIDQATIEAGLNPPQPKQEEIS